MGIIEIIAIIAIGCIIATPLWLLWNAIGCAGRFGG